MELVAKWRRWEIRLSESTWEKIAMKKALSDETKWAIDKESSLLFSLNSAWIAFVPQLVDSWSWWFSYKRLVWNHFKNVYAGEDKMWQEALQLQLLSCAYELDKVGIVHWELLRPWTNVLVFADKKSLSIIDFERWHRWDTTWKNMKHVAQRLLLENALDVHFVKWLWWMSLDTMYEHIKAKICPFTEKKTSAWFYVSLCVWILVLFLDIATKYYFVDLEAFSTQFILPVINRWIAWSIPIALPLIIWLSLLFLWWIVWYYYKKPQVVAWELVWLWLLVWWALGNLYDRIFLWWVRDFIDVSPLLSFTRPVFNLADIWITVGLFLLLYYEWKS